jgi:hypothetical protein
LIKPDKNSRNTESGMAFVTMLFIMVIISGLAMSFIYKSSITTSTAVKRGEGMQAHYLAESAANHAMWRLLNEESFPAAEDKYYMHSLAGGRYGYKVRRHTDTTFATVATVGAIGEHVVHQSYVLYVKPVTDTGPKGITWFLDSDSKVYTPWTGSWRDVDLSADTDIPDGATGVILEIVNESWSNYRGQVRAKGSTQNAITGARIKGGTQVTAFAKLDENKTFQAYRDNSSIKFYVRGYMGSKATLFQDMQSFPTQSIASGDHNSLDLSGEGVPANSTVILDLYNGKDVILTARPSSAYTWNYFCQNDSNTHQYVLMGVDSNSVLDYSFFMTTSNADSYQVIRLAGYIRDVVTWLPAYSDDVSNNHTGSWRTNDITSVTSGDADIALINVRYNEWSFSSKRADIRKYGSSDDQYDYAGHMSSNRTSIFHVVGLNNKQRFQSKVQDADIYMHVIAYGEPVD